MCETDLITENKLENFQILFFLDKIQINKFDGTNYF